MTEVFTAKNPSVLIDARGPRFSAALTFTLLSVALVSSNLWIVIAQGIIFAIGAFRGPQFTPYGVLFRKLIKPRLKGAVIFEESRAPQFAQSLGLLFIVAAIAGAVSGVTSIFTLAISFALAAAFLNAVFNLCLGCELYLLFLRLRLPHGR